MSPVPPVRGLKIVPLSAQLYQEKLKHFYEHATNAPCFFSKFKLLMIIRLFIAVQISTPVSFLNSYTNLAFFRICK